ncbi:MAG: hypothetical protein ACI3Z5_00790 [Paludibacteraceae bacterium]
MKHSILVVILLTMCIGLNAQNKPQRVPAVKTPLEYVQPDGDTLIIRLHGDERRHYRTTVDGYLIAQNKKGYYCYARYDRNGATKITCKKAHNADKRSTSEQKYIERNIPNKLTKQTEE